MLTYLGQFFTIKNYFELSNQTMSDQHCSEIFSPKAEFTSDFS